MFYCFTVQGISKEYLVTTIIHNSIKVHVQKAIATYLLVHFSVVKKHFPLQDSPIVVYSPHQSRLWGRLFHAPQLSPFY